ncbi:MAG: response regulator [Anaerolineales bacterium]|nr:response regulator [Anaerolineales bacterium]
MAKTALIVEDNKDLAETFDLVLSQMVGLQTHVLHDGQEASDYLLATAPDLLLLDLHLPYVNGQTILEQMAQNPRQTNTRVIVATADVFLDDDFERVYTAVNKLMFKPVSINALVTAVRELLDFSSS